MGGRRTRFAFAFLSPALALYALFVLWPLAQAFSFSLTRWRGLSLRRSFVGLDNYKRLAADPVFWKAFQNNLWLVIVGGIATIAIAIGIAHLLQNRGRPYRALRAVVLVPQMLSAVVVAVLWMFIYNPQFGLLTTGLKAVGLGGWVHTWLGESQTALASVGVAFVWSCVGFYSLLFAAGLAGLPAELLEAAELDGAVGWVRFRRVTWPMLWSIKRVAAVHFTIAAVNVFTLVYLMTKGGPDRATETLLTTLYENAFINNEFGYATTIAVANFGLILIVALGILAWTRRNPVEARR